MGGAGRSSSGLPGEDGPVVVVVMVISLVGTRRGKAAWASSAISERRRRFARILGIAMPLADILLVETIARDFM